MGVSRATGSWIERWLPLSGLLAVVIVVVTFVGIAGDTPESDASAATVMSFYKDHQTSGFIATFLLAAAGPFFLFYALNLALAHWPGPGGRPFWQAVLIAGGAIAALCFAIAAHGAFAVVDGADHLTPEGLQAVNVIDSDSWIVFNSGLGVLMLGAAGTLLTSGASRFFGWSALVLGVALFIPFADFIALGLTGIWIIVASIMQFRGSPGLSGATAAA